MDERLSPRSDDEIEHLEERATDAAKKSDAKRVREPDAWHKDYRTRSECDRDRILYCSAFRRLAYVTQVTAPESGHSFHSRLSHSLKVAQVGRRNAERLIQLAAAGAITGSAAKTVQSLDPAAVEASCLAHDLGHPPFGHITEEVLRDCARDYIQDDGIFEGNAQSFRIITRLAQRAGGEGLDLTRQTLLGTLKYPWHWRRQDPLGSGQRERKWGYYKADAAEYKFARKYSAGKDEARERPELALEALIMEWADDLTYAVHDVDDFFRAGLIPLHRLGDSKDDEVKRLTTLLEATQDADPKGWPNNYSVSDLLGAIGVISGLAPTGAYQHTIDHRRRMRRFGSDLITRYLGAFRVEDDPEKSGKIRVSVDPSIVREVEALKLLVRVYVILRPGLAVVQHGQQRIIRELFDEYFRASDEGDDGDRRLFPPGTRQTLDNGPNEVPYRARAVVDLIAGLTEETAIELHRRIFTGYTKAALDSTAIMA